MHEHLSVATLRTFRTQLYACFERRADALMELTDALLTAGPVLSPAHLSLEAVHRRGWGSLYAALRAGRINVAALRRRVAQYPLTEGQAIYAVDTTTWARCDAETSPQRGYYYHPSRHSAGQPIVAGWSYSWISQLSFVRDSWTAPLDVERVPPDDTAAAMAAEQIGDLLALLPRDPAAPAPLFVFDAGYNPVELALQLEDRAVQVLVRLRKDRCFYTDPDPVVASRGRPRRHGRKFICTTPATWWTPTDEVTTEDGQYGTVRVRAWAGLHALVQNHATKGTLRPRPLIRGTVVLVEVSRLPGHSRPPRRLWLWWRGPGTPDLAVLWRAYIRRFDCEHTFRFLKQTLTWTTPRVRHPEQADRWTALVLAAYTQLRLACALVQDRRLPWEHRLPDRALTPYRVRRAFSALLPALGTPAKPPKPCGRSPGRPKGRRSGPAPRHPALKKTA